MLQYFIHVVSVYITNKLKKKKKNCNALKILITKINLYRVNASVICKPGLYRAGDIVGKAGLRCHAYCKTVGRMSV